MYHIIFKINYALCRCDKYGDNLLWIVLVCYSHTQRMFRKSPLSVTPLCLLWQVMLVVVHPPRRRTIFPSNTSVTITHLPTYSLSLLITCPYHFDLHSCTFLDKYPTLFSGGFFTTHLSAPIHHCWSYYSLVYFPLTLKLIIQSLSHRNPDTLRFSILRVLYMLISKDARTTNKIAYNVHPEKPSIGRFQLSAFYNQLAKSFTAG